LNRPGGTKIARKKELRAQKEKEREREREREKERRGRKVQFI